MGATIQCRAEGCSRFYHFPCSAASGSFQSMKQLALLCPEHIDKAEEIGMELLPKNWSYQRGGLWLLRDLCVMFFFFCSRWGGTLCSVWLCWRSVRSAVLYRLWAALSWCLSGDQCHTTSTFWLAVSWMQGVPDLQVRLNDFFPCCHYRFHL